MQHLRSTKHAPARRDIPAGTRPVNSSSLVTAGLKTTLQATPRRTSHGMLLYPIHDLHQMHPPENGTRTYIPKSVLNYTSRERDIFHFFGFAVYTRSVSTNLLLFPPRLSILGLGVAGLLRGVGGRGGPVGLARPPRGRDGRCVRAAAAAGRRGARVPRPRPG